MSYINWSTDQNPPLEVLLSLKEARSHLENMPQPTFKKTLAERWGHDLIRERKLDKRGIQLELEGLIIRYEDFLRAIQDEDVGID